MAAGFGVDRIIINLGGRRSVDVEAARDVLPVPAEIWVVKQWKWQVCRHALSDMKDADCTAVQNIWCGAIVEHMPIRLLLPRVPDVARVSFALRNSWRRTAARDYR